MPVQFPNQTEIAKLESQIRNDTLLPSAETMLRGLGLTRNDMADVVAGKSLSAKLNGLLIAADQTSPAPTANAPAKKLGPADLVKQSDGSYLVATADDYEGVLDKLLAQNGGMLQGVHIKPNGDGTSTIRLGVTSVDNLGDGEQLIGCMM